MEPEAVKPYEISLLDYHRGNKSATILTIRDGG